MQLTMLNGAPNRTGKPSVKIPVLHNNTSYTLVHTLTYKDISDVRVILFFFLSINSFKIRRL